MTDRALLALLAVCEDLGPRGSRRRSGRRSSELLYGLIAELARAHDVDIDLEIVDDEVGAIRLEVTYGGCCGYEAAETLAARSQRPTTAGVRPLHPPQMADP